MRLLIGLVGIVFQLMFFSCVKEIDLSINGKPPNIVINAALEPNLPITIQVSQSAPISAQAVVSIDNAMIYLFEDNLLIDSLNNATLGVYTFSNIFPIVGKTYKFEVHTTQFGVTKAETIIPEVADFELLSIEQSTVSSEYSGRLFAETKVNVNVKLNDVANRENYYGLLLTIGRGNDTTIIENYSYDEGLNIFVDTMIINRCENSLLSQTSNSLIEYTEGESIMGLNGSHSIKKVDRSLSPILGEGIIVKGQMFWLSDYAFNGETLNFDLSFTAYNSNYCPIYTEDFTVLQPYSIYVVSMSKSFYRYCISAFLSSTDPFSEPVQVYSNVHNGYGVVTSRNTCRKIFYLEQQN